MASQSIPSTSNDRSAEAAIEKDHTSKIGSIMPATMATEIATPLEVLSYNNNSLANVEGMHSRINGTGLWSSWQRNFKTPELALLDLFDNAVDATLHDEFVGKIDIYQDPCIDPGEGEAQGICLRNNCAREIPDLTRVLEVFGSSKDHTQIGENGVGTKQACAALSNLSIIFSKNKEKVSIGVLFKTLQLEEGCCIPSFEFRLKTIESDFGLTLASSEELTMAVTEYGAGDIEEGKKRIFSHVVSLKDCDDDYLFLVVLHRILHRGTDGGIDGMLQNMSTIIPRNYLHIPPEFEVTCGEKRLVFQFWERRLVELHHFPIRIDPSHDFNIAADWHMPIEGHELNLFIGFDPVRAAVENKNKAALLVYSRKCGRLVKEIEDARGALGVVSSGTEYSQGLTIILDDNLGRLPLTPTKQDLAFGNEASGKVHEGNLFAWIGAFTHLYYNSFLEKYKKSKSALSAEVQSHIRSMSGLETIEVHETLQSGDFSTFQQLSFSKDRAKGKIRCNGVSKVIRKVGKATRTSFRKSIPRTGAKKRPSSKKSAPPIEPTDSGKNRSSKRRKVEDDANEASRLQDELNAQKLHYVALLKEKAKEIEELESECTTLVVESSESNDCPIQMRIDALQGQCEALESELHASRDVIAENEKLKKQFQAQKTYMLSLQNLNDSLRSLSDL